MSAYRASGFTTKLAGTNFGIGVHTLSIRILAADRSCYYQGLTIPIVVS